MLTRLAEEAAALREEPYDSPKVKLWKQRAGAYVERDYGAEYLKIFKQVLFFGRVVTSPSHGQQMHRERMDDAITFLTELQAEEAKQPSAVPADTAFLRLE